jgi:hypothetical protein
MILYFKCPHCNILIEVYQNELNCHIFRHGIYKDNFEQINPHLSKKDCDYLIENDLIYGCSKPFQIYKDNNNQYQIKICDYI